MVLSFINHSYRDSYNLIHIHTIVNVTMLSVKDFGHSFVFLFSFYTNKIYLKYLNDISKIPLGFQRK